MRYRTLSKKKEKKLKKNDFGPNLHVSRVNSSASRILYWAEPTRIPRNRRCSAQSKKMPATFDCSSGSVELDFRVPTQAWPEGMHEHAVQITNTNLNLVLCKIYIHYSGSKTTPVLPLCSLRLTDLNIHHHQVHVHVELAV